MKDKKNTEKEKEVARGKKRFQERLQEDKEAEQLIKDFEYRNYETLNSEEPKIE